MKTCIDCKIEKDDNMFESKRNQCKKCISEKKKEYYIENKKHIQEKQKSYYEENKPKILEKQKQYGEDNKEKIAQKNKTLYENNKAAILAQQKQYQQENKEIIAIKKKEYNKKNKVILAQRARAREKKRRKNDSAFRMRKCVSYMVWKYLKHIDVSNSEVSSWDILPYTPQELVNHIEEQFNKPENEWMNWNNQGVFNHKTWKDNDRSTWVWQLDHIKPHSDFYYTGKKGEVFLECWALSNLRPYSAKQNMIDGATRIRHKKV
jgi:hypothetical protein